MNIHVAEEAIRTVKALVPRFSNWQRQLPYRPNDDAREELSAQQKTTLENIERLETQFLITHYFYNWTRPQDVPTPTSEMIMPELIKAYQEGIDKDVIDVEALAQYYEAFIPTYAKWLTEGISEERYEKEYQDWVSGANETLAQKETLEMLEALVDYYVEDHVIQALSQAEIAR